MTVLAHIVGVQTLEEKLRTARAEQATVEARVTKAVEEALMRKFPGEPVDSLLKKYPEVVSASVARLKGSYEAQARQKIALIEELLR